MVSDKRYADGISAIKCCLQLPDENGSDEDEYDTTSRDDGVRLSFNTK
ncbi:hypothetical protein GCM10007987_24190 [Aliivibrio fischeri]|nr:hypothetical protein GCM10007987_24190 [Aliivibrio fischeri]